MLLLLPVGWMLAVVWTIDELLLVYQALITILVGLAC